MSCYDDDYERCTRENVKSPKWGLTFTDEASGIDPVTDAPEDWVMFFTDAEDNKWTAKELREIADEMDRIARATGDVSRGDV